MEGGLKRVESGGRIASAKVMVLVYVSDGRNLSWRNDNGNGGEVEYFKKYFRLAN